MITHDVDEAIFLADRIMLMTNGPNAVFAEIVDNPLPNERSRSDFHRHALYYGMRNHIIDFLVTRSRELSPPSAGVDRRSRTRRSARGRARPTIATRRAARISAATSSPVQFNLHEGRERP